MRREDGNALVEFALFFALLGIPLLLGTPEVAAWILCSIEASNAAHAGAAYAAQQFTANYSSTAGSSNFTYTAGSSSLPSTSTVTSVAQDDALELPIFMSSGAKMSVQMNTGCGTTVVNTNSNTIPTCSGNVPFVQVTTTATVNSLLKLSGLPKTITTSGNAVVYLVH
jgi:Flp pilus assembly protein TadG